MTGSEIDKYGKYKNIIHRKKKLLQKKKSIILFIKTVVTFKVNNIWVGLLPDKCRDSSKIDGYGVSGAISPTNLLLSEKWD